MSTLRISRRARLAALIIAFLLVGRLPAASQSYVVAASSVQKQGATKNVMVELHHSKNGFYSDITALEGAEFALMEVATSRSKFDWKDSTGKVFDLALPEFSPGDRNITIKIDAGVGFNELLGLKFLDPVVINVASDGAIESDRAGVRAIAFQGSAVHSDCFLGAAQKEGVYSIGGFSHAPMARDGSMVRTPGEMMECHLELTGEDGAEYVSQKVKSGDHLRILFVPAVSGRQ
jgi:hypothetical protein